MDHYYLLQFLNKSLFAAIQLLQTLNRLRLSFTALKNTFPVQGLPSATVTHGHRHPLPKEPVQKEQEV